MRRNYFCAGESSFSRRFQFPSSLLFSYTHLLINDSLFAFLCTELVADILKIGGLIDPLSNPGAATPAGLYDLYHARATTTANPYLLRQAACTSSLTTTSVVAPRAPYAPPIFDTSRFDVHIRRQAQIAIAMCSSTPLSSERVNTGLHVLNRGSGGGARPSATTLPVGLTLNSLDMSRGARR